MKETKKFDNLIGVLSISVIAIVAIVFVVTISNTHLAKGTYAAGTVTTYTAGSALYFNCSATSWIDQDCEASCGAGGCLNPAEECPSYSGYNCSCKYSYSSIADCESKTGYACGSGKVSQAFVGGGGSLTCYGPTSTPLPSSSSPKPSSSTTYSYYCNVCQGNGYYSVMGQYTEDNSTNRSHCSGLGGAFSSTNRNGTACTTYYCNVCQANGYYSVRGQYTEDNSTNRSHCSGLGGAFSGNNLNGNECTPSSSSSGGGGTPSGGSSVAKVPSTGCYACNGGKIYYLTAGSTFPTVCNQSPISGYSRDPNNGTYCVRNTSSSSSSGGGGTPPGGGETPAPSSSSSKNSSSSKSSSKASSSVTPSSSVEPVNPQTGSTAIIAAWLIGLFAIGYSFWYFKRVSTN